MARVPCRRICDFELRFSAKSTGMLALPVALKHFVRTVLHDGCAMEVAVGDGCHDGSSDAGECKSV